MPPRKIEDLTDCALAASGEEMSLSFLFEGGGRETFMFPTYLLPKMLAVLTRVGLAAEKIAKATTPLEGELTTPFHVKRVSRTGFDPQSGEVAIQFALAEGFPLILSMHPDQARQTIQSLQGAVVQAGRGTGAAH